MERVMIDMQREGWNIGAVVTDNAGQCGRVRRILNLRWPHITLVICFAHDVNSMVKAAVKSKYATVTKNASDTVNAINASSSKWLVEAQQHMRDAYGYELYLQQLYETRWNSMHACFALSCGFVVQWRC
ncbi:hypothetical protein PHYSODRAFT_319699 [Phytophthora sojae]|uniref:DUF659 domain-containing protein n=1 Tax=Phytophthora sojae (strain P6497) TaxID=1094619 RepID=G5AD31_PHYSP|nr:hypothetical protein PHYSODRAFT_319699 [Phytophthora sojae]EGZ06085.1 hypothetical protein PHYSODRAFT_319699 [Phytophthora sojae]|eukprot:XP_009537982.1 hypothetical protein PHYSODRAFT_319699 [Phytophthora sojae]